MGVQSSMLSVREIQEVLFHCFFQPEELDATGEPPKEAIIVEGICRKFGFHPQRLKESEPKIVAFLKELPSEFHRGGGGGYTFLAMCRDKEGNQWGEQVHCEQLLVLAIGIGRADYCFPRAIWPSLPGCVPYLWVDPS